MANNVKQKKSIFETKGYNNFMAKLYGIGAAIVIIGALFKIQHYPLANIFLPVGLGMEAVIFFFSAFQKPHVEPDWSIVYPQFLEKYHTKKEINQMVQSGVISKEFAQGRVNNDAKNMGGNAGQVSSTHVLDGLLEKAQIPEEVVREFGKGMEKFSVQAKQLNDITDAAVVTKEYAVNVKQASNSAKKMNESFDGIASNFQQQLTNATDFTKNIQNVSQAANKLAAVYNETTHSIKEQADSYKKASHTLAESLNAINSVYELQLKDAKNQKTATAEISKSVNTIIDNIHASQNAAKSYSTEMNLLTNKISALNKVYGNMLTAMNVNTNK